MMSMYIQQHRDWGEVAKYLHRGVGVLGEARRRTSGGLFIRSELAGDMRKHASGIWSGVEVAGRQSCHSQSTRVWSVALSLTVACGRYRIQIVFSCHRMVSLKPGPHVVPFLLQ